MCKHEEEVRRRAGRVSINQKSKYFNTLPRNNPHMHIFKPEDLSFCVLDLNWATCPPPTAVQALYANIELVHLPE